MQVISNYYPRGLDTQYNIIRWSISIGSCRVVHIAAMFPCGVAGVFSWLENTFQDHYRYLRLLLSIQWPLFIALAWTHVFFFLWSYLKDQVSNWPNTLETSNNKWNHYRWKTSHWKRHVAECYSQFLVLSLHWFMQMMAILKIILINFTHCLNFSEDVSKYDLIIMALLFNALIPQEVVSIDFIICLMF